MMKDDTINSAARVKAICRKQIPDIKSCLEMDMKKVRYINSNQQAGLAIYRDILHGLIDNLNSVLFGEIWISSEFPDIYTDEGENWLIRVFDYWSRASIYIENLDELEHDLSEFTLRAGYICTLKGWIERIEKGEDQPDLFGFNSRLSESQLKRLYLEMKKAGYISALEQDFISALGGSPLPKAFNPVKWIMPRYKTGSYKPHQKSLREFLSLLNITPTQKILNNLFVDKTGKPMKVNKPEGSFSPHYSPLEDIVNSIKLPTQASQE